MTCKNPKPERVCLCPADGHSVRRLLGADFINGWLTRSRTQAINKLACDASVTDEQLWQHLFALEQEASRALAMWESYQ